MLRRLFDSVSSKESSSRLGAMVDVLSSSLAMISDSRFILDVLVFSESCIFWMISSCRFILCSSASSRLQIFSMDLLSCVIWMDRSFVVVIVLIVGYDLLFDVLTTDAQDLVSIDVFVKLLTDSVASERRGSFFRWKSIVELNRTSGTYSFGTSPLISLHCLLYNSLMLA